jgi:hypothetical protein
LARALQKFRPRDFSASVRDKDAAGRDISIPVASIFETAVSFPNFCCGAAPLKSCNDRQRMTMMLDERFVRLRTHRNNIARYRRLLKTSLTDLELQFIERRLSEEQSQFELLSAGNLPRHS